MEGFGLPPLEALSFGLSSAVSGIPVFHEVLGGAAVYFDPKDMSGMAERILDGLKNGGLRNRIKEEGARILARHSSEKSATETIALYARCSLKGEKKWETAG
jgi:glycosyltransferase involved in cell wall biosynthesis